MPKHGDKVVLLDGFFESLSDGKEAAKLAKLPYVTVDGEPLKLPLGERGIYYETYEIYIQESPYLVGIHGVSWDFYKE